MVSEYGTILRCTTRRVLILATEDSMNETRSKGKFHPPGRDYQSSELWDLRNMSLDINAIEIRQVIITLLPAAN